MQRVLGNSISCRNCLFSSDWKDLYGEGECHYNPPLAISGANYGKFPMVKKDQWCRRFHPDNLTPEAKELWSQFAIFMKLQND